jgi:hypothetical protein
VLVTGKYCQFLVLGVLFVVVEEGTATPQAAFNFNEMEN